MGDFMNTSIVSPESESESEGSSTIGLPGTLSLNLPPTTVNSATWNGASNNNGYYFVDSNSTTDANIECEDLILSGVSTKHILSKIQERLAILVPDPDKLAKYEALRRAYEDYKILEQLCFNSGNNDDNNE
jgi:hypothetical protein